MIGTSYKVLLYIIILQLNDIQYSYTLMGIQNIRLESNYRESY